ncbi:hypothetical protein K466DRAFT_600411 [Polyporus arcularius HHB13444]|uniref:Uncharacterized protein n=1 Tax=Polyporus arcularius HHB13444 TaxID=1314778 RepID=A0A5C3P9G6_9APHY|nr:hypothetical protein K466DRAFT_600411 [Polyporus arcularius HHB13444]
MGVTYIFDSDEERARSSSRLSGTTAVPTQPAGERDSTYVPGDDEESDEDMYDGPSPSSYRKRPRGEAGAEEEGQTPRKSARLGGTKDHRAASTSTASSSSRSNLAGSPAESGENSEYIYVSSDSKIPPGPVISSVRKKQTKLPRPRTLASAFESVTLQPRKTSKGKEHAKKARSGPPKHPEPVQAIPSWFDDALRDIRRSFPAARMSVICRSTSNGSSRWGVKCTLCDPPREIVGPGSSLVNYRHHLTGSKARHFPLEQAAIEQPAASTSKAAQPASSSSAVHTRKEGPRVPPPKIPKKPKPEVADVVERFLKGMGLTSELAGALRRVGISDEARMKALGQLPDTVLDRLEKSLAEEGLDVSALLLVREGLKRRATAP